LFYESGGQLTDQEFMNWYWREASKKDKKLYDKMGEFKDYFTDMRFDPGSSSYQLIQCKSKLLVADEWIDNEAPRPEVLEYFRPRPWPY
jgi:hypothetical protein